ncbi:MAG: hypothetical protein E7256_02060 [Lachnospiraceae bacterium]|nr:hypothetical protein [Lachnospiraceae bacterium]
MENFNQERMEQYKSLEQNIMQTVYEWQVKIGYAKESMNVYFMKDSLCYYCGEIEKDELREWLSGFKEFVKERLGEIKVSGDGKRFCIGVPESGTAYIKEHMEGNTFLSALVEAIKRPDCTMEDIKQIFASLSKDFVCEKIEGGEFDYVLYYNDPLLDPFRYCFTVHSHGIYYHRFTSYDYNSVI